MRTALTVQYNRARFLSSIALIQLGSSRSQVDKRYIHLFGQQPHLIRIIHRMVVLRNAIFGSRPVFRQFAEAVAQIMPSAPTDLIICPLSPADRRYKQRMPSQCRNFINDFSQTFFICGRRIGPALVYRIGLFFIADTQVVIIEFYTVHASILFVIMCKLNNNIIAGFHVFLYGLPQLIIPTARITSAFGIIHHCYFIKKLL